MRDWLKQNGYSLVQGYRIAKPMPAVVFRQWLEVQDNRA